MCNIAQLLCLYFSKEKTHTKKDQKGRVLYLSCLLLKYSFLVMWFICREDPLMLW